MYNGIQINGVSAEAVAEAHKAVLAILNSRSSDAVKLMALDALSNACRVSVSNCTVNGTGASK